MASRIELTEVHKAFDGDAKFDLDRRGWHETAREDHATADGLRYSYVTLERNAP
jgi:dihydrofolate reductase